MSGHKGIEQKINGGFIRGPLPQTWFIAAFKSGKTKGIAVALMIWQRKAIEKSLTVTV